MNVREPTEDEIASCLEEARSKGLPEGWSVQWDDKGAKVWVYVANKHKEYTIPKAIAYSVKIGILGEDKLPASFLPKSLTEEEVNLALREARAKGLPEGFSVKWDNQKRRRVWITPDKRQVKGGLRAALKEAVNMNLMGKDQLPPENLTKEEQTLQAMKEAESRGLPKEFWKVEWHEKSNQRVWIYIPTEREFNSVNKALTFSVKKGHLESDKLPTQFAQDRALSEREESSALQEAKKQGLPEGWTVKWDTQQNRRIWISPPGVGPKLRRCDCISKAVAYSVKMNLIDKSKQKNFKEALTTDEEVSALQEARVRGLPGGWSVKWNSKKSQKQWIAPNGRICNSIPDALKLSVKLKLIAELPKNFKLSRKRNQTKLISQPSTSQQVKAEASADLKQLVDAPSDPIKNDLDAADVNEQSLAAATAVNIEDWQTDQTIVMQVDAAPTGVARVDTALATITSPNTPDTPRTLSAVEIASAIEEGKARGLPDGWIPYWDSKRKRRSWSYGDKIKCKGIPSAIKASKEIGLLPQDFVEPAPAHTRSGRASFGAAGENLTKEQREERARKEGKDRGLPDGWRVVWNDQTKCRRWISPDDRICKGISEALAMSVEMGLLPEDKLPPEYRERILSEEEKTLYLAEARFKGLPEGWSVGWNARRRQKIWIAPDGKTKYDTIPKALAACARMGLVPRDQLPKAFQERELAEEEKMAALAEARTKGLPDGWTVEWNANKGCRKWISPDGNRNFECISKAVSYSVKIGLIAESDLPVTPKKRQRKSQSLSAASTARI
jgi:hypothetical protein